MKRKPWWFNDCKIISEHYGRNDITDEQYRKWYDQSAVIDGVRMGPKL